MSKHTKHVASSGSHLTAHLSGKGMNLKDISYSL